jgi:NADP-dependent 3-hydroxy acid dehydrogenase YdfG
MILVISHENCPFRFFQEISPGFVKTKIFKSGGYVENDEEFFKSVPCLNSSDVSQAVNFLLMTDYSVNITEIIIKPTGEKF